MKIGNRKVYLQFDGIGWNWNWIIFYVTPSISIQSQTWGKRGRDLTIYFDWLFWGVSLWITGRDPEETKEE